MLIQRFRSANLNVHLHCLVLNGVCRCGADGVPIFVEVRAPTDDELHALLQTMIRPCGPALRVESARRSRLEEEPVPEAADAPRVTIQELPCRALQGSSELLMPAPGFACPGWRRLGSGAPVRARLQRIHALAHSQAGHRLFGERYSALQPHDPTSSRLTMNPRQDACPCRADGADSARPCRGWRQLEQQR